MAYGRKSKYQRRYARKGRSRVGQMAKGRVSKIQALARSVSKLQRQVRRTTPYLNYNQGFDLGVSADVTVLKLSNYSNWNRIFGTGANDDTGNNMKHLAMGIDCHVSLENTVNEPDTTTFTVFLVSLKDEIGNTFSQINGDLSLATGVHYVTQGGIVMLNKKCFNIHKIKRFVLSNFGQSLSTAAAQSQYGVDRRWYWKIKPRCMIKSPYGDWKSEARATDPSDNYYLLVFNDNSAIDLQNPKIRTQVVHTVQSFN